MTISENIKIILSILLGLILSFIVKLAYSSRNYILYNAPNPELIKQKLYKKNNKCYKLKTEETECKHN